MADSPADVGSQLNDKLYGEDGLAGTIQGCGIGHQQFKGLMDWYFHEKANETLANTKREVIQAPSGRQEFLAAGTPHSRSEYPGSRRPAGSSDEHLDE